MVLPSQLEDKDEINTDEIEKFKHQSHSLRIGASNVAALAGYNPYKDLPKLILQLVYQSRKGRLLQQQDARLLDISLVDEEEEVKRLASKVSAEARKAVEKAVDIKNQRETLETIKDAGALKEKIIKITNDSKTLNKKEKKILIASTEQFVDVGFGTGHEISAIDEYERRYGWEVRERNSQLIEWPFCRCSIRSSDMGSIKHGQVEVDSVMPLSDPRPLQVEINDEKNENEIETDDRKTKREYACNSSTALPPQKQLKTSHSCSNHHVDLSVAGQNKCNLSSLSRIKSRGEMKSTEIAMPFFIIVGIADGIRDELWFDDSDPSIDNDDKWKIRNVVIEVKHRMNRFQVPPPFYDQLQAIIYSFMYKVSEIEIVQVFREKVRKQLDAENQQKTRRRSNLSQMKIHVSRVSLDDPVMEHRKNWENTILPRLRSIVEAVYSIRRDDHKRYKLLCCIASNDDEAAWNMIHDECPWLLASCDTAFRFVTKTSATESITVS